jgi:predicted MFS family arabinose efflux permease
MNENLELFALLCRWGRKRSFAISCVLYIIAGPVAAFAPHYVVFCLARLALGMAGSGTFNCGFTLCKLAQFAL